MNTAEQEQDSLTAIGVSKEEAAVQAVKVRNELMAWELLIDGAKIPEISERTGIPRHDLAMLFYRKIKGQRNMQELPKFKKPKIIYKPVWPENLYCEVFKVEEYPAVDMPVDFGQAIEYALSFLSPTDQHIVNERLRYGKTLQEIGDNMQISRERIRQYEERAYKKLRHKDRADCLLHGLSFVEEKKRVEQEAREAKRARELEEARLLAVDEEARIAKLKDIDIKLLGLSYRANKCLTTAGILTVGELLQKDYFALMNIRWFGEKSLYDVINRMDALGADEWVEKVRRDMQSKGFNKA